MALVHGFQCNPIQSPSKPPIKSKRARYRQAKQAKNDRQGFTLMQSTKKAKQTHKPEKQKGPKRAN